MKRSDFWKSIKNVKKVELDVIATWYCETFNSIYVSLIKSFAVNSSS